jgi:hypothetical protein
MSSAGIKTAIPAIEWGQTYALDHRASGIGYYYYYYYYYHYHNRISHFSASAGKHSGILGYVINRNRFGGLTYNLKSFLQLNMFQELQIFPYVCTYSDTG